MKQRVLGNNVGVAIVIAALSWIGCVGNESGKLSATQLGNLGNPAKRGSPTAELQAACGASGAMTADAESRIARDPYLQQLTSSSVLIGWLATTSTEGRIEITTPDKEKVATVAGEKDTTVRATHDHQMWANVTGLAADTIYCYSLVDGSTVLSERIGFRTPPPSDSNKPVRFLAFGDSGSGGSDQSALRAVMDDVPFDLVVHTGDIAYDSGKLEELEQNVFGVYGELFRHLPFFPVAGNHDYKTMNGAPFRDVFNLPGPSGEKWYSYDWGMVHFVAFDTEADYATQVKWLDEDLAKTKLPWKILYLHHPPYSTGEHGSDVPLRKALAPVLAKHHVQLVLSGHDHHYERMVPQGGTAYIVTGGGGKGTRPVGKSEFTAYAQEVIHFVYVEVNADELVLHAIDATGTEFDSMVVPR